MPPKLTLAQRVPRQGKPCVRELAADDRADRLQLQCGQLGAEAVVGTGTERQVRSGRPLRVGADPEDVDEHGCARRQVHAGELDLLGGEPPEGERCGRVVAQRLTHEVVELGIGPAVVEDATCVSTVGRIPAGS